MNDGNFRIRCIESGTKSNCFTVGMEYDVINGYIHYNNGVSMFKYYTLKDITETFGYIFELVEEKESEDMGNMECKDLREMLKPCMLVKCRDGILRMVVQCESGLILKRFDVDGWIYISDYNDSLKLIERAFKELDIIEIYGYEKAYANSLQLSIKSRELIWKREEKSPQQIEIEQIEAEQQKLADRLSELKNII